MPRYIIFSAATLGTATRVDAATPRDAIQLGTEKVGGSGKFVCVAVSNMTVADVEAVHSSTSILRSENVGDLV